MDEFTQHLYSLKKKAFECQARGKHRFVEKAQKRDAFGRKVVLSTCQCGTENHVTTLRDGRKKPRYFYPDGYLRGAGAGRRTAEMNAQGWEILTAELPLMDF